MLKHVLVPLDGSPLAEAAAEVLWKVISTDTHVTLLTVVHYPSVAIYDYELAKALAPTYASKVTEAITRAKNYLQRIAMDLRVEGFNVQLVATFGDDAASIINTLARELQVDAIVMGTHGRSGISRWVFGSVTGNVLSGACCPVFVVPNRERERVVAAESSEINYG
ncbi:MAG: universal stress protein [Chloroflexota bacterium]